MTYEGYERLANEIVLCAVKDYRAALKRDDELGVDPDLRRKSIEVFFRSDWFKVLTNIDGEFLINELKKEAGKNGQKHKRIKCN